MTRKLAVNQRERGGRCSRCFDRHIRRRYEGNSGEQDISGSTYDFELIGSSRNDAIVRSLTFLAADYLRIGLIDNNRFVDIEYRLVTELKLATHLHCSGLTDSH